MNGHICCECKTTIHESDPHEVINGSVWCGDCAFLNGHITESDYVKRYLFWLDIPGVRAVIRDKKVHIGAGKFTWERTSRDRNCQEYTHWRSAVFERDGYTCRHCGIIGGKLNAHHIMHYKDYPDLRYVVSNGITLCEDCHKKEHRRNKG